MKDSEIYLRAAKRVNEPSYRFSCCEIDRAAGNIFSMQREKYHELFAPKCDVPDFLVWGEEWGDSDSEVQACRVLALLFMHQIALDEERKAK